MVIPFLLRIRLAAYRKGCPRGIAFGLWHQCLACVLSPVFPLGQVGTATRNNGSQKVQLDVSVFPKEGNLGREVLPRSELKEQDLLVVGRNLL